MFHMHTCKACVKWIEKLTEQEMLLRERECRRVVFFFYFFLPFVGLMVMCWWDELEASVCRVCLLLSSLDT